MRKLGLQHFLDEVTTNAFLCTDHALELFLKHGSFFILFYFRPGRVSVKFDIFYFRPGRVSVKFDKWQGGSPVKGVSHFILGGEVSFKTVCCH